MDFLVAFDIDVPDGTPRPALDERMAAEAAAAARLVDEGHLLRVWRRPAEHGDGQILGLYRADTEAALDGLLGGLPLREWMHVNVTPLEPHPNDPATVSVDDRSDRREPAMNTPLPDPRLTHVYRLEVTLGNPMDLGETAQGHRRIVPLTGGIFTGPEIRGTLLPGASADWQLLLPDGTAIGDIRYTLQTETGELLYVRSRGVRHGSVDILTRLGRGEQVDASEYTFRTSTQIETAAPALDWLNKGVFIGVGGRQSASVVYDTYLVE
jgi:muconolactone delta-isomerase